MRSDEETQRNAAHTHFLLEQERAESNYETKEDNYYLFLSNYLSL